MWRDAQMTQLDRAPSLSRGRLCPHGPKVVPDRRLPHRSGKVPTPPVLLPSSAASYDEASSRVHDVRPPSLPQACGPRTGQGPSGFYPELHTLPLPVAHVEVGTGIGH